MVDQIRKSCHNKLTTMLNTVLQHENSPLSYYDALEYQRQCDSIMDKCLESHFLAVRACTDDAAIDVQDSAQAPIEATAHKLRVKLQEIIISTQPSTTRGQTVSKLAVKLPDLELPVFDGSFANWMSFKDLFLATVDKHPGLSSAQKLQYLRGKLAEEPANLIKSLLITDGNYKEAWKLLDARYNNQREIVYSWLDKLLHQPRPMQAESANGLQSLLDNTNECLRALEVLKIDIKSWDHIIISTLLRKVDANTRCEWAIRQTSTSLPTFAEFSTFLNNHIRGLLAKGVAAGVPTQRKKFEKNIKSHATSYEPSCQICKGSHSIYKCEQLQSKSPKERSSLVKSNNLCFNCFSTKHRVSDCPSKSRCRRCGKRHHTLLHEDKPQSSNNSEPEASSSQQDSVNPSVSMQSNISLSPSKSQVLLSTAIVLMEDHYGIKQPCRAFLDTGSQVSFISENCVRRLKIKRSYSRSSVSGIASSAGGFTQGKVNVNLHSQQQNSHIPVELHVLPKITGDLPSLQCRQLDWSHLKGLELSDPEYYMPQRIDILIGADYYAEVLKDGIRRLPSSNAIMAQETIFGWVLCGRVPLASNHAIQVHHTTVDFDIIKKFWEVEEPPKSRILTKEEKECEAHFQSTYKRDENGRFIAAIPFNSKRSLLGSSKSTAIRRFYQVEKRLQRQPQFSKQYVDFMREYALLNHMERVPEAEREERVGSTFYLPHHFVVNDSSSTTKLRVVFDGSVKSSSGVSLNDTMLVGASLQDELYFLLLRFRTHAVVLKADITKMFRQFRLSKEDADMHRIVWRESPREPLEEFRLTTITYGTASASNLSTRCVHQLGLDVKDKYQLASNTLLNDMYVDDVMSGAPSTAKAITLYHELNEAVATAGIELRKWSSNSKEVLQAIPISLQETSPQSFDDGATVKALGVQWHPSSDCFKFKYIPVTECKVLTKRILLSDLARVFDPLGLISCVTIRAKILLQELWKNTIDWDDPVPSYIQQQWKEYQEDMKKIPDLSIPRKIVCSSGGANQLHGFCDASETAYGAVLYLRSKSETGGFTTRLITSKTKVAPLRQITLPRLELMGALLLAELVSEVQQALRLTCEIFLWTDSTITLRWISSQPRRWKTFVANRVAKIQEYTPVECWRHVPGSDNPADLASRGVTVTEIISSSFWLSGPQWLEQDSLPVFQAPASSTTTMEERSNVTLSAIIESSFPIMEKYSTLIRLKRVTSYLLRFLYNTRQSSKQQRRSGPLTASELQEAILFWVKRVQYSIFAREISALKKSLRVHPTSKLRNLHPYLDNNGLLRISGRLHHSHQHEDTKHQLILPANCHLTDLIISHFHLKTLHGGFQLTWSSILAYYWIIGGRNKARLFVRSCVICRRFRAKAAHQLMGSLPESRVNQSRPFSHCGVDYAGPFTLKNPVGRAPKTYKGYLCIFVCMATKAIHLEPVSSLSTEDFIATFRRFCSRRGFPSNMYSDRGTNFVGAEKELQQFILSWQSSPIVPDHLSSLNITWHWNPPSCAHAGGLWEAGVKSAKHHLRRVVGNAVLTFEQFATILCQIESILNSRPLYPLSSDPTDFTVLTPGHFLIGDSLMAVPDADLSKIPTNRLNIYQQQQSRVQHFWQRWSRDYLNTLQQRNKWWWDQPNLKEGNLVLVVEDTPPGSWKMARVTKVYPGHDGKVRVVSVRTALNSTFKRATVKLIPLFNNDK